MLRDASEYFDAQAASYQEKSQRGLWQSLRRFEQAAILDLLGEKRRGRVLELGCGAGYYSRLLLREGCAELVCSDVAANMLEQLRGQPCELLHADMQDLVLDRHFDCILAAGSLEFVDRPERVFKNVSRMLAAGGVFVALVPLRCTPGRLYALFHLRHGLRIRLFDRAGVEQMAAGADLRALEFRRCGPFSLAVKLCAKG